jgi:Mitochondrial carrier protein
LLDISIAGSTAGVICSFLVSPVEHMRIRMQMQTKETMVYSGSGDALKQIYSKYGLPGVYRGYISTLMRDTPFYGKYQILNIICLFKLIGLYFWVYHFTLRTLKKYQGNEIATSS